MSQVEADAAVPCCQSPTVCWNLAKALLWNEDQGGWQAEHHTCQGGASWCSVFRQHEANNMIGSKTGME